MPRKRRTQPGTDGGAFANRSDLAQPIAAPTGLAYGERQGLEEAQQQQPLPREADPFEQVMQAARGASFQAVPLNAPSARPGEPVTAGLASGAGPGPEILRTQRGLSDLIARVANESGDDTFLELLDQARRMGL